MDQAAVFNEITQRNALRRATGLPILDVRAEYARQVSLAREREFRTFLEEHAEEREAIRGQVLSEYRERFGPGFGSSMGGRWAVGEMTRKRFAAYMEIKFGAVRQKTGAGTNMVIYGAALKDEA